MHKWFSRVRPLPFAKPLQSHTKYSTIYALSTPAQKSALAIIRISGPESLRILQELCKAKEPLRPRYARYTAIYQPQTKDVIDHGLLYYFASPSSSTGEDMGELHVHGGTAVVKATLNAIRSIADVSPSTSIRYAEAGEFTKRAFYNGKMDLTMAEGLKDLIEAETEEQRKVAVQELGGASQHTYAIWREKLLKQRALLEAIIDFGEDEEIDNEILARSTAEVQILRDAMQARLLAAHAGSELISNGFPVVLTGKPNVGKSSLLNAIARREAAIVSPEPGTTRDVVELSLNVGGYKVNLSDTAGLRQQEIVNSVEKEGIRRARDRINASLLRIFVTDHTLCGVDDLLSKVANQSATTLLVVNKVDQLDEPVSGDKIANLAMLPSSQIFQTSCITGAGITDLLHSLPLYIKDLLKTNIGSNGVRIHANARQRALLEETVDHLKSHLQHSDDIVASAEFLKYATDSLGKISGQVDPEEVLGIIFSEFCIGK